MINILKTLQKKLYTCFIDFRKAFDLVWHLGLFYKLRKIGVSDLFYNVIKNMYLQTSLCVKVNNGLTPFFPSTVGVRQGDNLSPTLFRTFINDLPNCFDTHDGVKLGTLNLNCLLYADDLVLFSSTADGLQNSLNKLNLYCKEWGLEVNKKKSKCMIFNKAGRLSSETFFYNNELLENVRDYSYLGCEFQCSGLFNLARQSLYNKGLKTYFKFSKCFKDSKPSLQTFLHIFDHTVLPVMMYGSEIWGLFKKYEKLSDENKADNFFNQLCKDLTMEKLHIKACKQFLCLNKRSTNIAVMGEVGRFPLMLNVILSMFKFWRHILNSGDVLLTNSYEESSKLHAENKISWVGCISALIKYLKIDENILKNVGKEPFKSLLLRKLKIKYQNIWKNEVFDDSRKKNFGNKLRTYRLFKNNFGIEKYLSIGNLKQQSSLCKFRISNHTLEIERGRYKNIKVKDRICKLCNSDVEDEIHFLLGCSHSERIRAPFIIELNNKYPNTVLLDNSSKFIWLMSAEDDSLILKVMNLIIELKLNKDAILKVL